MLLFFYWPLVRGVCPNDEVLIFNPRTGTPLDLGSVTIILNLLVPSLPVDRFPPRGATHACYVTLYLFHNCVSTQDNYPTWASPVSIPVYRGPLLSILDSEFATSLPPPPLPGLLDFQRRALAAAKISFKVAISCFHHGS